MKTETLYKTGLPFFLDIKPRVWYNKTRKYPEEYYGRQKRVYIAVFREIRKPRNAARVLGGL